MTGSATSRLVSGSGASLAISARDRRDLHFAEPRADFGGEAGIGSNRREVGGLADAEPDAGIGDQPVGGGDDVAGAQRGVERKVDRRKADGSRPLQVQSARSALR